MTEQAENQSKKPNLIELSPNKQVEKKTQSRDEPTKGQRVITKIQAQKAKNRFNVFVNGKYSFAIDDNILVTEGLFKGKELTDTEIEELREKGEASKAYQAALNYLSYKMRSEKEIRDYLKQKDYPIIEPVIEKLKNHRLINDEEYGKSFVRTSFQLRNEGPKKIERKLVQKGLTHEEILTGLDEYSLEQQKENAVKAAEKTLKRQSNKSNREIQQKVREQLMLNGFETDIINEVLNEMDLEKDEDEEYTALVKQGEKAWKRYSRKHKDRELVNKTKSYLYSKGYPRELIDRFINEKEGIE